MNVSCATIVIHLYADQFNCGLSVGLWLHLVCVSSECLDCFCSFAWKLGHIEKNNITLLYKSSRQ